MIFLNPAILFGLFAASIPVIIHLFNLRKLKKIEFSTLAFLKELQKNKIRKIKLKQWILLALRVLIILFIVMAFARPTLKSFQIGGTTSAAKTTAIFILDDTFSMSVVDQKGSYFNQGKEIINKVVSQLQEGDEVGLILVSNPKKENKLTSNLSEFLKTTVQLDLNYTSGDINSALVKSAQLISESKNFNKEIYVLSDFQKDKIINKNITNDLSELLNESVKLYSFDLSDKDVFNLSVDDLKINNQIFEKDKPVSFSITVTNNSNQDVNSAVVSLFLDNERAAQKSFDVKAGQSTNVEIEAVPKSTGFIDVTAEIETDEIEQDNKRFASLFIPEKISVGLFAENNNDLSFVDLALQTTGETKYLIERKNINQLSSQQLNKYQTIIFSANSLISGIELIKNYIQNGGGLFLFPSSVPDQSTLNQFYSQLGLGVNSSFVGKVNSNDLKIKFDKTDFNHPIFQNVFQNDEKKKYESPEINAYYKNSSAGNQIISLVDGSSFLSEIRFGKGKILVFNCAPVLTWSDFPIKSIFAPLMNKSVAYLSSKERDQNIFIAGEEVNINLRNQNSSQIKIVKPDKSEEFINLNENSSRDYLAYSNTNVAGNYKFYSGDKLIDNISINTDPAESKTNYADENDFENYLKEIKFDGNYVPIDKESNITEKILQARFGSELWRYFLLVAIILALIEMTIARNTKKDLAGIQ
ncbi:MAG: BatA and WFA domain-containing protein [Ignavibacteriaceae bacterium]|nr:BatA and WFA domain-containing protein [Ignavibacterium sp.]MCC6254196.1 BatA and WFA domain-containing protein [Ignavibacteriaceae bacterium]HRN25841.1 BatA and WFA domain-containing protein [Ignavibacteriaceae bacterium]HRP91436.1 BatA and WFA domain-containing protein [Ignavibacteriaceae bacterium]HRQ53455.1 BatA and WFA domain-containing protein [Ignavibacteriaceae bacterium]